MKVEARSVTNIIIVEDLYMDIARDMISYSGSGFNFHN